MSLKFEWWRLTHREEDRLRRQVIEQAEGSGLAQTDSDIAEIVEYLRHNPLRIFPYPFAERYTTKANQVKFDQDLGLPYVEHEGKKLYWREGGGKSGWIERNYKALRIEQDEQSPHRYLVPGFSVNRGDIVADIGCAEAIFGLEVVERASHLYLFESDGRWMKALEATFRPWKEKVTIVHATLGADNGKARVTLDDYFADKPAPNFYKLDVEGAEAEVLNGAGRTLARAINPCLAVCAYHRPEDEANLAALLDELGYVSRPSRGYILLYDEDDFEPPYFRRAVLRAMRPGVT